MALVGPTAQNVAPYRDSLSSDIDVESASESGDVTSERPQDLAGRSRNHDRRVLDEEDEREELLTGGQSKNRASARPTSNTQKRRKARKDASGGAEAKELIYDRDVEEGDTGSRRSSSSAESSAADHEKLGSVLAHQNRQSRFSKFCKYGILNTFIAILFVLIAYGAYLATRESEKVSFTLVSNGTQLFAQTTIVVSLDGFRADFLHRDLTPTLNSFIRQGVSPKYMLPSFPSVTFPNHYTLVTGLYPESHGVVGNTFWDPELKEEFYYTHPPAMQPKWWGGEPLWVTAERQGVRTGIHMWPGSEAHIAHVEPSFLDKFNGSEVLSRKVDRILELLDKPSPNKDHPEVAVNDQRPQIIMSYVPNVDADGHKYGPNSTEIRETIQDVDTMLAHLFEGLEERNLTGIANVVVVSDHGMATTSVDRLIQFEDLVDPKYFDHIDGWPLYGLRLKDPDMLEMLYDHLVKESYARDGFDVYLRDDGMPKEFHFSNNERIAPLWIVPLAGWAIVTKDEFDVAKARKNGDVYHPRGLHGYDHAHPLMRSIFVARGPAFPHKPGSKVDVFQNTEVYNIICDSVGLKPKPNNGTIRLPFKTTGVHREQDISKIEDEQDPPRTTKKNKQPAAPTASPSAGHSVSRPVVDKINGTNIDLSDKDSWPDWFRNKFDSIKDWVKDVLGIKEEHGKNKNGTATADTSDKPDKTKQVPSVTLPSVSAESTESRESTATSTSESSTTESSTAESSTTETTTESTASS